MRIHSTSGFCDIHLLALTQLMLVYKGEESVLKNDWCKNTFVSIFFFRKFKKIGNKTMPNINIENISDLDINGNELFEDSESFFTEITDDNGESVVGGFSFHNYHGWYYKNPTEYYKDRVWGYKNKRRFRKTNNCGQSAACANTLGGYLGE